MANRGCYLLLLFLALTGDAKSASAQAAALQVQVYDYTGFSPAALHEFITRTEEILTSAGVSVEVDACARGVSTPCESRRGSFRQLVIRVVAGAPRNSNQARWQHLGQSIATRDGGTYASVYLKLAEEEAAETNLPRILVLSYAAAHEVGHLLLGDEAHTPQGLMKASWEAADFQAIAQNRFHFSAEQARELKRRYGLGARPQSAQTPGLPASIRAGDSRLRHLRHPDGRVDLRQVDEDLVPSDAQV